jgi:hypothetical protein
MYYLHETTPVMVVFSIFAIVVSLKAVHPFKIYQHIKVGGTFATMSEDGIWRQWGRGWNKKRDGPFQGPPEGVMFLFRACFCTLRSQMRDFHDLPREKLSSPEYSLHSLPSLTLPATCLKAPYWSGSFSIFLLSDWLPSLSLCSSDHM